MKKATALMIVLALCITLSACGKSEAAEVVDSLILSIGTVTLNSENAITTAEYAYAQLPDKDKEDVENLAALLKARTTYDGLLQQALQAAEETNQIIQQAREKWEAFDISGTLEILDSITAMTVAQEEEINAFYEEIEDSCYKGTHFLKLEHRLGVSSDNQYMLSNSKYRVSHDETKLDDNRTYTEWCGKRVSVETDYPELWSEWAIYDSAESEYPKQARVDDLGNVLAYFYRTIGTDTAQLEFTIFRNS